jgi:putative holliday junction resolvase
MQSHDSQILALDVGEARIGLAVANSFARLPRPHSTIKNTPEVFNSIKEIVKRENITEIVVGLPLGLNGQETKQTQYSRQFAQKLERTLGLTVYLSDETLTSFSAEQELRSRGKSYGKGDIDALAATIILEDYLNASKKTEGQV